MRIGIDASTWNNSRGYGRFTRELVGHMMPQRPNDKFILLTDTPLEIHQDVQNFEIVHVGADRSVVEAAVADDRRQITDILAFRKVAAGLNLDVLFYPTVYSWFPPAGKIPNVLAIHDAIAERFPDLVFPQRKARLLWTLKTWLARRATTHVVTPTEASKADIVELMRVKPEMITVTGEGANATFQPCNDPAAIASARNLCGLSADQRAIVFIGGFAPHKNLRRLLDAFESVLAKDPSSDLYLVMVGDPSGAGFHSEYADLTKMIEESPHLANAVSFPGYISDRDMAALLSDALVLVLPSVAEGFGLPALEAISCGCPVIAPHGGAVAEVVGAAGLCFDVEQTEDLARALEEVASNDELRERLRAATLTEAQRNTWDLAASRTLETIERAARLKDRLSS